MEQANWLAQALTAWEWWAIGGILLLAAEVFLPGAILLWPGIAALVIAALALLFDPPWQVNLILFALISLASAYFWRSAYLGRFEKGNDPSLNQRGQQLVGRLCTLASDTQETGGRAQIGDTTWSARTEPGVGPLPAGTRVRVLRVEGTHVIVAPEPPA